MITKMKKLCNTLRHFVERQHKRFFFVNATFYEWALSNNAAHVS